MKYIEVKFNISPDNQTARDLIMAFAGECGFESFTDDETGLTGYCQDTLFNKDALQNTLENIPLEGINITFKAKDAEYKNWNEEWEKNGFDPIIIEDKCLISCYNKDDKAEMQSSEGVPLHIVIDAKQAFGTGTHETTQMIVSALFDLELTNKRVLDCGCGTGILGITAGKLGAKEVVGYDIDEWSVENAKHNAELNNINIEVFEGDKTVLSHINGMFDIVLANINRNILLNDLSAFADALANDGNIILSGFYEEDASILLEKAQTYQLTEYRRLTNHGWCCLILGRK